MKEKCYLGFDVGKNGAICGITESGEITLNTIPLTNNEISLKGICDILKIYSDEYDIVAAVEDVHSIFNAAAKANFQFGRALGILEGFIGAMEFPFIKIAPKGWQKVCHVGIPTVYLPPTNEQILKTKPGETPKGSVDTKAMSLLAAERLFPKTSFLATSRSKKPHDGLVDALLIAYYLKQTHGR